MQDKPLLRAPVSGVINGRLEIPVGVVDRWNR